MLLNSHISANARCLAGKGCSLVWSTWGTSQGEDKLGARDKILNTKVARRACAGRAPGKHSPITSYHLFVHVVVWSFLLSLSSYLLCLCPGSPPSAHVFCHCMSSYSHYVELFTTARGLFEVKYEVGGEAFVHEGAAFQCIEFKIRSPPPPRPHYLHYNPTIVVQLGFLLCCLTVGLVLMLLSPLWLHRPHMSPTVVDASS